jgi:thioredoxin-related protein
MVLATFFLFCLTILASASTNVWLSKWTDQSKKETISTNETSSSISNTHSLIVFSILGCSQGNKFKKISAF